ncbi:FecR family protein [Chitinophaga japonensis]|uniref:FecR family protein n=1 Tax=Chitinophaga japonensis TaxID=104662 RepID=A0A562T309_CHIJA|nr:FecR domain-containing protein [Chitinophaga japonensis]TWI87981.1 FecR family protein [Chitinophaga japonensis]
MEWKDYTDFTATDFLADSFFMEWVLHPDEENCAFWEAWQQHYPEKQAVIAAARTMLSSLEYEKHQMPAESYDRIWHALHGKMDPAMPETMRYERSYHHRGWRRAAILTGVCGLLALGLYWLLKPADKRAVYTSQFGENRRLLLPDSSVVILGPHSALKATAFDGEAKTREVWLEGEAYFMVKHDAGNARPFTVHAGDLDIEVLGTEFNVNNYNGRPQVVLHSGKVALQQNARKAARIVMEPGELIEYRADNDRYVRRKVSTEKYVAWVNHTLVFENTSLKEVAAQLHHKYGIQVQFADSTLLQERFSATLKQADHKVVLRAIQEAFSVQLQQQDGNTFLISR